MLSSAILRVLALASFTNAFVIPANTVDGVYSVRTDERGFEIHEKLAPALRSPVVETAPLSPNPAAVLEKRATTVYCGCGYNMNHGDCDAAVADLKGQISANGGTVKANLNYYSIRGSVVAFLCNRGVSYSEGAADANIGPYLAYVTSTCGLYVAGTYDSTGGSQNTISFSIGYMNYYNGLDFCAAATSSGQHSC